MIKVIEVSSGKGCVKQKGPASNIETHTSEKSLLSSAKAAGATMEKINFARMWQRSFKETDIPVDCWPLVMVWECTAVEHEPEVLKEEHLTLPEFEPSAILAKARDPKIVKFLVATWETP